MAREALVVVARTRKRTWVLLGLGAAILGLIVWSALGGFGMGAAPTPPPIPVPNGYDEVLEAGQAIEQSGSTGAKLDLAKADEQTLIPVVQANREALALARKGLEKSFQVPIIYDLDYMMQVMLKDLSSIRTGVARGLTAEGRLADFQGRVDDAAHSYTDLVRLGDALSHQVPMLAYLVSIAVQSTGYHHLRDIRAKLSPQECRRIIDLLEAIEQNNESLVGRAIRREKQFMDANLGKFWFPARISMQISGMHSKGKSQVALQLESAAKRQTAARRVLLTELAIRVYRQDHGADPADLNALVPSILASLPIDPYTDMRLRYRKRGNDGIVYSLGPDKDDDKLTKPLPPKHTDTTDGDFTIDSF